MKGVELIRSFIAVDVDESLRARFKTVQEDLKTAGGSLKLVEAENLHLTLKFLGEIPRPRVEAVAETLGKLRFTSFKIKFEGVGCFPTPRNPRVVWVGVSEGAERLRELAAMVEEALRKIGFQPDPKGFTPHLTIARVKSPRDRASIAAMVQKLSNISIGEMLVDRVRLKKSTLTPRGPIYSNLYEVRAVG